MNWIDQALCRGSHPALFFPERGASTAEARRMCFACPVREQCLDHALANGERCGIWGGVSERQRRRMRAAMGPRPQAKCGTHRGYERHRERGETTCQACRDANARYKRNHRQLAAQQEAADCGTTGGYQRHRRLGQPACQLCRDANARYQQDRRTAISRQQETAS